MSNLPTGESTGVSFQSFFAIGGTVDYTWLLQLLCLMVFLYGLYNIVKKVKELFGRNRVHDQMTQTEGVATDTPSAPLLPEAERRQALHMIGMRVPPFATRVGRTQPENPSSATSSSTAAASHPVFVDSVWINPSGRTCHVDPNCPSIRSRAKNYPICGTCSHRMNLATLPA